MHAVQLVEALQFFRYTAISDDVTCERCNRYDGGLMTRTEMRTTFPYLEKVSDFLYYPHTHMPRDDNCRCVLTFEEEQE